MRISPRMLRRQATITERTASDDLDDYGNAVVTETTWTSRCDLQQRRADESNDGGQIPIGTFVLYLPPGRTPSAGAAVTVDDVTYEVVGDPWEEPRSHVQVGLERAA